MATVAALHNGLTVAPQGRSVLRSPFSVLRSPGRRKPPLVLCGSRAASGFIAAKGGGSGSNLRGSSKPPSLQTSKLPTGHY